MAVKPQPKQDATKPREEGAEPLMDGMNNAMRKMLAKAKEKGFITSEELNAVLPSEQVSTDQIEDIMAQLNEMGINVVEADEETEEAEDSVEEETRTVGNLDDEEAPTIPCACTCARWARSSCCRARAKSPLPSASRPAAT
jgi:RNA polymerase primary sigma factor